MKPVRSNSKFCWSRPRLVVSWLVLLAVWLLLFLTTTIFYVILLIGLLITLRPYAHDTVTDRHRLGVAIAALVAFPLMAILIRSSAVLAFLQTPTGVALLTIVWAVSVVADLRYYRRLPPFRPTNQQSLSPPARLG